MENALKILVIDDEESLEVIYTNFLSKIGAHITFFDHPQKGWRAIDKNKYDLIITDLKMPAITGDEFIKIVRESKLNALTPVILCSAYINKLVITEMSRESKVYFLTKPFESKALFELVDKAIGLKQPTAVNTSALNEQWLKDFTEKLSAKMGPVNVEKIDSPDQWNFESISLTIFYEEKNSALTVNLLMKTKSFLKIAGAIQGTQYKDIENENLSIWESFVQLPNFGKTKMTCAKVLSHKLLLMPGQGQSFYRLTCGHEEIYTYIN